MRVTWGVEGGYITGRFDFFWLLFAATQLALHLHQERTQEVCSNKEARKRLAQRHSRNGPWT